MTAAPSRRATLARAQHLDTGLITGGGTAAAPRFAAGEDVEVVSLVASADDSTVGAGCNEMRFLYWAY